MPRKVPEGKRFVPGQSGNPSGRPKKLPKLDELMAEVLGSETQEGKTQAQEILESMVTRAMKGDVQAAQLLLDRAYGKAKQPIEADVDMTIVWQETKTYDSKRETDGRD